MRSLGWLVLATVSCSTRPSTEAVGRASSAVEATFGATREHVEFGGCVRTPDGVVLAGGINGLGATYSTVEIFDEAKRVWNDGGATKFQRASLGAIAVPTGVLLHGGYNGHPMSDAEIYDPKTHTSRLVASSTNPRNQHVLAPLAGGRVIAIGGNDETGDLSTSEIYDPAADKWSVGPSMAMIRSNFAVLTLSDGRTMVVGNSAATTGEVLSADGTTWTQTGPLGTPRSHPALAQLNDGRVVLSGGSDAATNDLSTTELWNPATNQWSAGPPNAGPRYHPGLVKLAGGSIIAMGDYTTDHPLERLDPKGTAWSTVGSLSSQHYEGGCVSAIAGGAMIASGSYGEQVTEGWLGSAEGEACIVADDCASANCTSGKCVGSAPDAGPGPDAATPVTPTTPAPIGAIDRCNTDADCSTGHCSDGVCCDTACNDLCHSCLLPGHVGTCTVAPFGIDLRQECGVARDCTGTCGGDGKCASAVAGSQCAPSKCTSSSTGVGPTVCTAAGARCPSGAGVAFDCAPYACEPAFGACHSTCATSLDCAGGYTCDVGSKTCVAPASGGDSSGGCVWAGSHEGRASGSGTGLAFALLLFVACARRRIS